MNFASDNGAGVAAPILEAIVASSRLNAPAYGADAYTARAASRLSEIFERELAVFLVSTGTAANALALAALTKPWQAAFCHEEAHIIDDECGAPEFFSGGAKLVGIPGLNGKIEPAALRATLARFPLGQAKTTQPAALSLSQATEAGTAYRPAEIAALAAIAHEAGMGVHLDGARFANALVATNASPAEMTWRAGVDILSLGATKDGALACEAVIVFDPDAGRRDALSTQAGGSHPVERAVSRRADGGVAGRRPLARPGAPRQYERAAPWRGTRQGAGRSACLSRRGQRGLRGCARGGPCRVAGGGRTVP